MSECIQCETCAPIDYPVVTCPDINYAETLCDPAFIHPIKCSYWGGTPISCLGIATNDTGEQVIQKIATAICLVTDPIAYSNYVKISPQDTTAAYLEQKIVAGTNVTITKQNTGANERLCINATFTPSLLTFTSTDNTVLITSASLNRNFGVKLSTDAGNSITKTSTGLYAPLDSYKVKTTIDDTTPEFLLAKLVAGSNITLTKTVTSGVEKITIASTASGGISTVYTSSSNSILVTGNGTLSTPIVASIKLSSNIYNAASFDTNDGSLLVLPSDKFAKVSLQDTTASYLENKIVAGTGITRTKLNSGINESLEFSIDTSFNGLIRNQTSSQALSNFYITGLGRIGSLRSDGDTFLSPSITTGAYSLLLNNTATGRVEKISPDDFIASYSTSYTLPTATTNILGGIKIGSGLTITSEVVSVNPINLTSQVSGILSIANGGTGSSTQNWVDLTTDQSVAGIKTFTGSFLKVSNSLQVNTIDTSAHISAENSTLSTSILGVSTKSLNNTSLIDNGIYGQTYIVNNSAFTHTVLRNVTGNAGVLYFNNTSDIVLYNDARTAYSGLNGTVYGGNTGSVTGGFLNGISSNCYFNDSGNYSKVAGIKISIPSLSPSTPSYTGTISNYYGLYIPDIATSNILSNITNKFAIYQEGSSDISRFYGTIQTQSGSVTTISDERVKENVIDYNRGLNEIEQIKLHRFNYSYNKDKTTTGVLAQELESIIPEAVFKDSFDTKEGVHYSDFRSVDTNMLLYTAINAIKELSQKIKLLENK